MIRLRASRIGTCLVVLLLAACTSGPSPTGNASVAPTGTVSATAGAASPPATVGTTPGATGGAGAPDCAPGETATPAQTEGPYYTPGSPEKSSLLETGMAGTVLVLTGYVVDTDCAPIAGATIDVWQADDAGEYDNSGFRLRGHLLTGADGSYRLETIVPGEYPGRTPHIHVKVIPPGGATLTTQLYLPDEPGNANDGIFRPETVMSVQPSGEALAATFTFVLAAG